MPLTIPRASETSTYPILGRMDRIDVESIVAAARGNGIVAGCTVTTTGSANGSVSVAAGFVRYNDIMDDVPATIVQIAANAAGNPRLDLITIPVVGGIPVRQAGTAAADPVFPAVPAGHCIVAVVFVPNGHTTSSTIAAGQIVQKDVPVPRFPLQTPDFWSVYGHSYWQYNGGANDQTGRADSLLRGTLDIEHNNWRNHAKNGAIAWYSGMGKGNWSTLFNTRGKYINRTSGPYCGEGGAALLGYGINDLGTLGVSAQIQALWKEVNRAMISRCRAGVIYRGSLVGRTVFGAGFAQATNDYDNGSGIVGQTGAAQGGTYWNATAITNANITMTLPSDYAGETVAVCFLGSFGGAGLVTFTGTAGVTGTLELANETPSASFSYSPMVKRFTGLTSANAGQTIIATVTRFDAGTSVKFTDWWLESLSPPPVLVCNINRPHLAGYSSYTNWVGTEAVKDQDVLDANTGLAAVVAEFDSMVQVVDIDAVLAKSPAGALTSDGLHPNEIGAAKIVDQCAIAMQKIFPISTRGNTAAMNTPAPRSGNPRVPHMSGKWYTTQACNGFGTSAAVVAGDQYAMPFIVTEGREVFMNWSMEAIASVTGTAVRIGCYDDVEWLGYPQKLIVGGEPTAGGAATISTGAGLKTGAIGTPWRLDPGLYWNVVKFTTVGAAHTFRSLLGPVFQMTNLSSTGIAPTANIAGYKHTGRGTTALEDYYPQTGATEVDGIPFVGLQLL